MKNIIMITIILTVAISCSEQNKDINYYEKANKKFENRKINIDSFELMKKDGLGKEPYEFLNTDKYEIGDLLEYYYDNGYEVYVEFDEYGQPKHYAVREGK